MKLKQTFMIDGHEVESEGITLHGGSPNNDLKVFRYTDDCQFYPEIILYFVSKDGEVVHTLSISASGGPEGSCSIDVDWGKP